MPIYEYECKQGHRFEQRQRFSDDPLSTCVECGQSVRRLLSPAGIIFKGSGWYITDSRPSSGSEKANGDSAKSTTSEAKADTKTETKSEPAPAKKAEAAA